MKFIWYEGKKDGKQRPAADGAVPRARSSSGTASLIVGEKGDRCTRPTTTGRRGKLLGKDAKDIKAPKEKLLKRRGGNNDVEQKKEWVEAIKANNPKLALSNFDYAAMLTEAILLGNVAMKAGKKLEYDGEKGKFTNDSEANKFLQPRVPHRLEAVTDVGARRTRHFG